MSEYGYTVEVPEGYDEAVIRTRLALKSEGFSIFTEMHVGGMISPQAGDERQYLIMGYWNEAISEERIDSDLKTALHLPCNIVVQERGSGAIVAALDPSDTVGEGDAPAELTDAARVALGRVLEQVERPEQ